MALDDTDPTGTKAKTEVIALALEDQAAKAEDLAKAADRQSAAHQGARDAIKAIEQGLKGITPQAEKELEAEADLDGEGKVLALKAVARAMIRVAQTLETAKGNQQNLIYLKQGEATAMMAQAKGMREGARIQRDTERARAESIAMGDAHRAAREAEADAAAASAQAEADAVVAPPKAKLPVKRKRKRAPANGKTRRAN